MTAIVDAIDGEIELHRRTWAVLDELYNLMTGSCAWKT